MVVFTVAGATPIRGLVRLLDGGVLAPATAQAESGTAAWPVPTAGLVHVALAALAQPRQIELLDGLGWVVQTQPVAASSSALTLDLASLPARVYALRVHYAQGGPVVRRVVRQ